MRSRADAAPAYLWVPDLEPGIMGLTAEQSHYVARVCRARPGDLVTITDGRGGIARAHLLSIDKEVRLEVGPVERVAPDRQAWILCGAPEAGRADWLVEKLGEFGVAVFQPVQCARGRWSRADARLERWRRLAVAALRQSRGRFLLDVRPPVSLDEALTGLPSSLGRDLLDPEGLPAAAAGQSGTRVAAVGPASGFDEGERTTLAAAGFGAIRLAESRLRTETAAMAWASWWAAGGSGSSVVAHADRHGRPTS